MGVTKTIKSAFPTTFLPQTVSNIKGALGGRKSVSETPPSAMDLFNAKVIAALAPLFFQKMAPGLAGIGTSEGAGMQAQILGKGADSASKQQLAPGTSQMFSLVNGIGQPGNAKKSADMMLLMYGKQPNLGPTGGSQVNTPGLMDITRTAGNIATLFEKSKNPLMGQQPTYDTNYSPSYNSNYNPSMQPNQYFPQEAFPKQNFGGGY